MNARFRHVRWIGVLGAAVIAIVVAAPVRRGAPLAAKEPPRGSFANQYAIVVRPLVAKYCLGCHSTKDKKGSLDLERFGLLDQVRKEVKPWQQVIELLEAGEMPPKDKPQPTGEERKQLVEWVHGFLDAEARANAGDPGHVPLRRLSNAEYDYTIRDLTGIDLRPTREFPADGAAGEGFTNAAEALSDISPALLTKYLNAAKDIAEHAVLLPDGFRFSPTKTRRDWTDESTARLRQFYTEFTADGRLNFQPYLAATVRHRTAIKTGKMTIENVARIEKLNAKYLDALWTMLTDHSPSHALNWIRVRWIKASESDVPALTAEISAWQAALSKFVLIGSYRYGNTVREVSNDPAASESQSIRLQVKPIPGQSDIVLYLSANDGMSNGDVVWQRPRFEAVAKPPLLLRDYAQFGAEYEVDFTALFADTAKYLGAALDAAHDRKTPIGDVAKKHGLNAELLQRWIELLALKPDAATIGRVVPSVALQLLDDKVANSDNRPAINGWRKKGTDLPILVTNSSGNVEQIPGRVAPHGVSVHPMPQEFVAIAWKSPIAANVRIAARVAHAHPACGNGVAWSIEHRRADRAAIVAEGAVDLGKSMTHKDTTLKVEKDDLLILAVDAKNADHVCDMTEIDFTVVEADKPSRTWNLSADIADNVLQGNPHADKHGTKDTWSFVRGPSRAAGMTAGPVIPPGSLLGKWRDAALKSANAADMAKLATEVQALLVGQRPANEKAPDRLLFDNVVTVAGPLLHGLELSRLGKRAPKSVRYGADRQLFRDADLVVAANKVTEIRLPAALLRDREFVVEAKLDAKSGDRVVQFQVATTSPRPGSPWDGRTPVVATANGSAYKKLLQDHADFRRLFPTFICFPDIVPTDEVVTLKMYHREDEPLFRLLLNEEQKHRIDHLWAEHRFISQQPLAENKYLPQFIGFVTQDQPKELLAYFEGQRGAFQQRADKFEKDVAAAIPTQLNSLIDFAARAYRRPLQEKEKSELRQLYSTLRTKGVAHDNAFRGVLSRVLVAPAFLFRIEHAPPGDKPGDISGWELATRLSYFLWSTGPDDELRRLAAAGQLRDPKVLAAQTKRMIADDRIRALAIEFGTQWLHVRGFDELKEKNEKLFPSFDASLKQAIYEESILFFKDLFQADRAVNQILDADTTFLNEALAKHYGIPKVTGPQWRRVEGVKKYGRGGILGLASVQTKQAGASRTSPVLRGNWVVETLLGEKLPRPPANVPQLPEEEGTDKLTVRQQVEKHARLPECAVCHVRIDPFGFALENYDPIGRRRDKDLGGLAVDARAKLKDGTEFDGIDGLRTYLLTKKHDVIVRLFCKRLLGYALGRTVTLSDTSLIDEMIAELKANDGRVSAAVLTIVGSVQFRMIRGADTINEN